MALAMALSLFPMTALAVPMDEAWIDHANTSWYSNNNSASEFTISTAAELAGLAQLVNKGNNFSGKTITLGANIDLAGKEWTPIGTSEKPFNGTFNGNKKTISNLTVTKDFSNTVANSYVGLFGLTDSLAVIKDLTITNVDLQGSLYVGAVVGNGYTGSEISNCGVTGKITIDAWWYAGVIGGNGYVTTVKDCNVKGSAGSYIKGNDGSYIGGIWGYRGEGNNMISNCSVSGVDISGVDRVGGICGIAHYQNTIEKCSVRNLSISSTENNHNTGLIAGADLSNSTYAHAKILDCTVADTVTATAGGETVTTKVGAANHEGTLKVDSERATVGTNVTFDPNNNKITGGTLEQVSPSQIADDYAAVKQGDGTYLVSSSPQKFPVSMGTKGYNSLSEAIAAANDSQDSSITITIQQSDTYHNPFTITHDNVTIQAADNVEAIIAVDENAKTAVNASGVTLKGLSFVSLDGTTIFSGGSCDKLTLDGCIFTGNGTGTALYIHQPNIAIKGCTFQNFERGYYTCGDNHAAGTMTFTGNIFTNVRVPIDGYWGKPATDNTKIEITGNTFDSGKWDAAYIQLWDYAQYQYWLKGNSSTLNPEGNSAINATIENNAYQGNVVIYATHFDWFSDSRLYLDTASEALVKYRYLVELENAASATVRNADGSEITAFNESTASSSHNGKTVIYSICEGDYIFDIKPTGSTEAVLSQKVTVAKPAANSTNKVTVPEDAANVAQVGNQKYTSLAEALAAAHAGDTVELLSNVEVDTWNQVWNLQGITLDGNGYTLTIKNIASGQNHDAVFHSAGGNTFQDLTIDLSGLERASLAQGSRAFSAAAGDTYKNITILGNKNLSYGMTASGTNVEDETITIDGCTFENCGYGIYDDESGAVENLVITNSSFTGCEYATILRGANSSFTDNTVSGGRLNVMQDGQTVTGNTFTDSSLIKFYANGAQFEQNKISQDSRLDFGDSFTGRLDVSHNYWGGGAPTEEQLGSSENVTGNDVYYIRDTMRDQDLNTYIPPDTTPYYTITVKDADNGTVTCYAKSAAKGADVTLNVKADVGYQLDKLTVTDASGNVIDVEKVNNTTYTFVMPGSKVTVEAVFAPTSVEPSDLPFTDVSTSDWFYGAVKFVYENGLMDGVGNNLFAPNATLNRAMAATILYRLEGAPAVTTDAGFNDVATGTWYTDAVKWAVGSGLVNGVEGNALAPQGTSTRAQAATALMRFVG